jgi:hypothetical protein
VTSPQEAVRLDIEAAHRRKSRSQRADRFERLGCAALETLIARDSVDGAATPPARGPCVGHTSTYFDVTGR